MNQLPVTPYHQIPLSNQCNTIVIVFFTLRTTKWLALSSNPKHAHKVVPRVQTCRCVYFTPHVCLVVGIVADVHSVCSAVDFALVQFTFV